MTIAISRNGIGITYKCYKFPGHGKKCPDKETSKCFECRYCKAELSAFDATRLLNSYGKRRSQNENNSN